MTKARWEKAAERRRMRLNGTEEAEPKAVHYKPMHAAEAERAAKLRHYLETSPKGERDVEPLLDAMQAARAKREAWLREVLNACED
jgi:hypothetical protein